MTGTGTFSAGGGTLGNNLTFNTTGTITLPSTIRYATGTWTYTSGTILGSQSSFIFNSCTLNTNPIIFGSIQPAASGNIWTLTSDLSSATYSVVQYHLM